MQLVAACDGLRGAQCDAAAALRATCGISLGQQDDGVAFLPAAVAQYEPDEAQLREERCTRFAQLRGVDGVCKQEVTR